VNSTGGGGLGQLEVLLGSELQNMRGHRNGSLCMQRIAERIAWSRIQGLLAIGAEYDDLGVIRLVEQPMDAYFANLTASS